MCATKPPAFIASKCWRLGQRCSLSPELCVSDVPGHGEDGDGDTYVAAHDRSVHHIYFFLDFVFRMCNLC